MNKRGLDTMNNIQRLCMEIKDIHLDQSELTVYLLENGLEPYKPYVATSNVNKRSIYLTALQALENLANSPTMMASIRIDDMTASDFYENLMKRIDQLESKIRTMPKSDNPNGSTNFLMFN